MDKLKLAHDYALKQMESLSENSTMQSLVSVAWKYADAMQAEAKEREDKTRPEVLLTKDKDGKCLHFHHEFGHKKCMDCGEALEEWQPDWSQAPKNMNYFFMNKDGSKYWTVNKPDKPNLSEHVMDCLDCGGDCYAYASSQDYQGNWQNSLRKRPGVLCEVDWSQAPRGAAAYMKLSAWDIGVWIDDLGFQINDAPTFGLTGSHIVERPHGF